ncbi:MAG: phenylalanine--tRNA ligase subunit beta [Candidatus Nitrospinota bacterium M3_3B_026]
MLISYLWLRELVGFDLSPEETAATLTGLGLECSIADDRRGWYEGVVIGKVLKVEKHPNADKLKICEVDTGGGTRRIVCGAPNVAEGQTVPVALPGSVLPDGMKIESRKVRGETSEGMIPSEAELRLSEDHSGIMVLDEGEPGEEFSARHEVRDTILEVDLTPNRGDCLSMIGVAREVAAATGARLELPPAEAAELAGEAASLVSVEIEEPELCPRYSARVIKDVSIGPSPFWMRRRLMALGVRPINNVVDITNYVLMETGHPLHAFDYHKMAGGRIIVRMAREGEKLVTLDGRERLLGRDCLVIADAERAAALAGVMGGADSEVSVGTRDVLLEAAYFDPRCIRRASRSLGISSESSHRFERGTDIEGLIYAQDRAARLMALAAGGKISKGRVDAYPRPAGRKEVRLRFPALDRIMGVSVNRKRVEDILSRLRMEKAASDDRSITVLVPTFRHDIEREIDLVEEVARHMGYNSIPSSIPRVAEKEREMSGSLEIRRALRRHLRSIGMMEGMRMSFVGEADMGRLRLPEDHPWRGLVPIDNPLSSEWTHLRPSLLPGLLGCMKANEDAKIFELGVVFRSAGGGAPVERWMVGGVISEKESPSVWGGRAPRRDFFDLKGVVVSIFHSLGLGGRLSFELSPHPFYYPKRQADVLAGGEVIGNMGQIHPETLEAYEADQELFAFELDMDALAALEPETPFSKSLPRFPSVKRDLAVVAPEETPVALIVESIRRHGGKKLREAVLFDVYRGGKIGHGKKSLAFSLEMRDDEKTLTDEEAGRVFEAVVKGLEQDHGAKLR